MCDVEEFGRIGAISAISYVKAGDLKRCVLDGAERC